MKKIMFMAASAALALASCSSEEELAQVQAPGSVANDGAVTFSAYTGRDTRTTAASMNPIMEVAGLANAGGFGVYAYEQGKADFATFSASNSYPNFMYNQNVWACADGANDDKSVSFVVGATPDHWAYAPVKYYSNNEGAKHSFFAYAPYSASAKAVFTLGSAPAIRYTAGETTDLMWAQPTMNMHKAGITHKIAFDFKHALSKVKINVAPFCDAVHSSHTYPLTDPYKIKEGTVVTLRSVKFIGNIPSQALLSLETGQWKTEATEESAYEIVPEGLTMDYTTNTYRLVKDSMMVIPTRSGDKVKVQVVYDVVTTDSDNPKNNSTVTNTITSEEGFDLIAGTAYDFKLDLGLTSVKFTATTINWNNPETPENVDLPNNQHFHPLVAITLAAANAELTITEPTTDASKTDSGYEYALDTHRLYNDGIVVSEGTYCTSDGVVYVVTGDAGACEKSATNYAFYTTDGSSYKTVAGADVAPTPLKSLVTDKEGKVQPVSGAAEDPSASKIYSYDGKLYMWKTTAD